MQRSALYKTIVPLFCIAGFVVDLIAFHPGFLNYDSFVQYKEALAGQYTDWHPPVMAAFWRMLNFIDNGPLLMLVFQLSCLWISCYLLLSMMRNWFWFILIAFFTLAPFTQNFAGFIVKDSQMALTLLLSGTIMFRALVAERKMAPLETIVSLVLIVYATWVRHNAFTCTLPFLYDVGMAGIKEHRYCL